jgi:hypothetical protein
MRKEQVKHKPTIEGDPVEHLRDGGDHARL